MCEGGWLDSDPERLPRQKRALYLSDSHNTSGGNDEEKQMTNIYIFLIVNPTRSTNFSNLFWSETLHVSDSPSVHHQDFLNVHTAMVYVIQVC